MTTGTVYCSAPAGQSRATDNPWAPVPSVGRCGCLRRAGESRFPGPCSPGGGNLHGPAGQPPQPAQEDVSSGSSLAQARAGKCVVRLKGGDPFVFGRGGEEALALVTGIPLRWFPA